MEFSIFRLEIRGILFGIAVLCYIVYCIKKESFYLHFFLRKKVLYSNINITVEMILNYLEVLI